VNELKAERGALVTNVDDGGPAAGAGIRAGDVITTFGGMAIRNLQDFHTALWSRRPAESVNVGLDRQGEVVTVRAVLATDHARPMAPAR
jgi:S1-C subfamily serine protease